MVQVIPLRVIVLAVGWFTASLVLFFTWTGGFLGTAIPARYAIAVVNGLLLLATWKPLWRKVWALIPPLGRWFPDLNGRYEVELRHNWPIQQRMLQAASGGEPFDPTAPDANLPPLGVSKLVADIDMGFYAVAVRMWSEIPTEVGVVIDASRTLSTSLIRACDGHGNRIAYVYQQKNRRDRQETTDDSTFEGAAILEIRPENPKVLQGEYWTNRAWHRGLSTAGTIVLRRALTS